MCFSESCTAIMASATTETLKYYTVVSDIMLYKMHVYTISMVLTLQTIL